MQECSPTAQSQRNVAFVHDRWCNRNCSRDDSLWAHAPRRRYVLREGIETRTCPGRVWCCGRRSHSTSVQCPCNMACHHRHLRHGLLNKRRHVLSGLTACSTDRIFSLTQFEPLTVPWLWTFTNWSAARRERVGSHHAWRWRRFRFLRVRSNQHYLHLAYRKLNRRGDIDLPHILPGLGGTRLEILVIFNTFFVLFTRDITAWCVKGEPFVIRWVLRSSLANTLTQPVTRLRIQLLWKKSVFGLNCGVSGSEH